MTQMKCSKGFKCYKSNFTEVGKAEDIGMQTFVTCLEEPRNIQQCEFALPFGGKTFCNCPLRVYLSRNLHI